MKAYYIIDEEEGHEIIYPLDDTTKKDKVMKNGGWQWDEHSNRFVRPINYKVKPVTEIDGENKMDGIIYSMKKDIGNSKKMISVCSPENDVVEVVIGYRADEECRMATESQARYILGQKKRRFDGFEFTGDDIMKCQIEYMWLLVKWLKQYKTIRFRLKIVDYVEFIVMSI